MNDKREIIQGDALKLLRELMSLGVTVYFKKENVEALKICGFDYRKKYR